MDNKQLVSQQLRRTDERYFSTDYKATGIQPKNTNKRNLQSKSYTNCATEPFTCKLPFNEKNKKSKFNDMLLNEKKYLHEKNKQTSEQKNNSTEKGRYSSGGKRYHTNENRYVPDYNKPASQNINLPQQIKTPTTKDIKDLPERNMFTINKNKPFKDVIPRKQIINQEQPIFFLQNIPGSNNTVSNLSESSTPSLICTAINYKGEPVKINNQLVTDKLILSCQPVNPNTIIINDDTSNDNIYPFQERNNIMDVKSPGVQVPVPKTFQSEKLQPWPYVPHNKYFEDSFLSGEPHYKNIGTQNPRDSLQMDEDYIDKNPIYRRKIQNYYGEAYINSECQKYFSKFRCFLWILLIDNIFLNIIGLILLLTTIYYIVFRDYISTVIGNTGFVTWLWITLILSIIIIAVAIYGIVTAIVRNRTMLITYIFLATVIILLIILYLLLFWISFSSLHETQKDEMKKTFNLYRCVRHIRVAWDTVHKEFRCCGKLSVNDWKYVPTSCCSSAVVKECIGHFITPEKAYQGGCTLEIEDYFRRLFLIIIVLLALAVTMLVIGIIGDLQLLSIYKIIILCNERYSNHQWREGSSNISWVKRRWVT